MTSPPPPGAAVPGSTRFSALAGAAVDAALAHDPVEATYLGDHRHDGRLADPSRSAAAQRAAELRVQLAGLAAFEPTSPDEQVDAAVLRTALAGELLQLEEIRETEWNPMVHNPGGGLHGLITRDFAPLDERLGSVVERLAAVPSFLDAARSRLGEMSRIHLDTAVSQLEGTITMIDSDLVAAVRDSSALRPAVEAAAAPARQALVEHREWLADRASTATRDPRLGEPLFRAKLALTLDTAFEPTALLASAERDLERITAQILDQAGRIAGVTAPDAATVRDVLDQLAADAPTDATILGLCRAALADTTDFVRGHELITVHDDPIAVVEMPEIDRGVAVAYCRANGPLEPAVLPTDFAVSPTPADWTAEQVDSFYREYNVHMLHNLTVHEAMPGHALQLMHANRHRAQTRVRQIWSSGSFVEGWAVYAEELMVERGYRAAESPLLAAALRMQQLKMQLRSTINAILDIRFHCGDLNEAGALELMIGQGFQEPGEATGKWRRVQLSSTQLCTYYVGYTEVRAVVADLRRGQPQWTDRQVHDAVLAHGSPPVRHLRTLLGLPAAG
jgi:uncharacterized protein (DUF885 family)